MTDNQESKELEAQKGGDLIRELNKRIQEYIRLDELYQKNDLDDMEAVDIMRLAQRQLTVTQQALDSAVEALEKMAMLPEQLRSDQNYTEDTDYERGFETACELLSEMLIEIENKALASIKG